MDEENFQERQKNRFPSLFGLYPLPGREDALENRTPTTPPTEPQVIRMLVKISELKFDIDIEPIFVTMALYNAREKKKISETFHFDCNPHEMMRMVHRSSDDYHEERAMASLSRSCIFSITYPHSDIFLVLKVTALSFSILSLSLPPFPSLSLSSLPLSLLPPSLSPSSLSLPFLPLSPLLSLPLFPLPLSLPPSLSLSSPFFSEAYSLSPSLFLLFIDRKDLAARWYWRCCWAIL